MTLTNLKLHTTIKSGVSPGYHQAGRESIAERKGNTQAGRTQLLFHNFCRNHLVEPHFHIYIDEMWFHIFTRFGKEIPIRKPFIEGSK